MAVWEDVVTTGLIGTDRRPVPDNLPPSWGAEPDHATDPAHVVLSLAAQHRAVRRAGGLLQSCQQGTVAPPNREPVASRAAHEILDRLLSPPQADLLNLWLIAAAQHGQGAAASYWTSLAIVAARSTAVDRTALARTLGVRGVWFVEQNAQWSRLARSLRSPAQNDVPPEQDVLGVEVTEDAVRADPDLIMRAATPWSGQLSRTVLALIGSGLPQHPGARYAAAIGARLPLQHYELLRALAQQVTTRAEPLTASKLRSVREALLTLERTVWLRIELRSAFSGEPIMVDRVEIPPW
jgi:hypothetical protein